MNHELLSLAHVRFAYSRHRPPVLNDISLRMNAGEIVILLGPNGSGKSTLIKAALGHLRAQEGSVTWEGRDIREWRRRELAQRVAYLPQAPLFEPEQRVADVLRLGRAPYWSAFGIESAADVEIVRQVSATLALDDLLDRRMDELSGGQRQMAIVGRCLVQQPRAMLLDEPNTFLDLRHQMSLGNLLRRLTREREMGILMASHDLNLAAAFADRLILLDNGRIAAEGPPDAVIQPSILGQVYGVPMHRIDTQNRPPAVLPIIEPDVSRT